MADYRAPREGSNVGRVKHSEASDPLTACRRCRQQKLRCSKEKPSCKRCQRSSAVCSYPPPPDRKLLAAQRAQHATAHTYQDSEGPDSQELERPSDSIDGLLAHPETTIPPPEVALFLIEIYFSHWNAVLLFHKPSFTSDYLCNKVPDFVSLSVFALASILLRETPQRLDENIIEPAIISLSATYCSKYAYEWARTAGRQLLSRTSEPSLENIQAGQNLAFYWFARGNTERTYFYTSNAYLACRLLRFHLQPDGDTAIDPLLNEVKRRCFWSCWMAGCSGQDNASFKAESWKEAVGLPLPSDEASFLAGKPEPKEVFADNGDVLLINGDHSKGQPPSILAELVKAYGLWWDIQRFVRQDVDSSYDSLRRVSRLVILDRRLEIFFENLHPDFRYPGLASFTSPKTDPYRLFSLLCLSNLCACALYSSIVPVFSGTPSDSRIPKKLSGMYAEEAVKCSMFIADIATAFLGICPDISRLSGLSGYALFVSCSVQFKALSAQGQLQSKGTGHCNAAISILKHLKEHSHPLQGIWASLNSLFSASIDINNLSSSTLRRDGQLDPNTDIEQIISQKAVSHGSPGSIDLYTFVANVETQVHSPAFGSANTNSQDNTLQAQSAATTLGTMKRNTVVHEIALPMDAPHDPGPGPFTVPLCTNQPSEPQLQLYHAPPLQSQLFDSRIDAQQGLDVPVTTVIGTLPSASFAPATTSAVDIRYQMPILGQEQANTMDSAPVAMEIDSTNLWWDQGFELGTKPGGLLLGLGVDEDL